MDWKQAADFINQTGFPIFVAMILLLRVDTMHKANLEAIHELKETESAAIHELTTEIKLLRTELQKHTPRD